MRRGEARRPGGRLANVRLASARAGSAAALGFALGGCDAALSADLYRSWTVVGHLENRAGCDHASPAPLEPPFVWITSESSSPSRARSVLHCPSHLFDGCAPGGLQAGLAYSEPIEDGYHAQSIRVVRTGESCEMSVTDSEFTLDADATLRIVTTVRSATATIPSNGDCSIERVRAELTGLPCTAIDILEARRRP